MKFFSRIGRVVDALVIGIGVSGFALVVTIASVITISQAANAPSYLNTAGSVVPAQGVFGVEPSMTVTSSSGNVANAAAVATLAGAAGLTTYISGFRCDGGGATAAALVSPTVAGTLGGTMTFTFGAVAGAALPDTAIQINFTTPIPASAPNTAIVVTLPALGAGNLKAACSAWGYRY
jgi:hypothetical protein